MNTIPSRALVPLLLSSMLSQCLPAARALEDPLLCDCAGGPVGGRLVVSLRSEPRTLNPLLAIDSSSRAVIERMSGDLIHIDRVSQGTYPALAKAWSVSRDGRVYTLNLRRGLNFSDGHPFDAGDVVFTFRVHLDEKVGSPQRDLLVIGGQPIGVRKIDSHAVEFRLAQPYAAAERLFDGIAILPRHRLEKPYLEGTLGKAWSLTTPPREIAGLGPFRLKEHVPGQRTVLERNPYFWVKDGKGNRLPYLDHLVFTHVSSEDAQTIRFQAGEADVISRISAENFAVLEKQQRARGIRLVDLGPGLEYTFLVFNLSQGRASSKTMSFQQEEFRRAVSLAIDRESIVRLAYRGRAVPLGGHVTSGNKRWLNRDIAAPRQSLDEARGILKSAGFSWNRDGFLLDRQGDEVGFSILASSSNAQRLRIAALIQDDLKQIGIRVNITTLEFRTMLDRVFKTRDFEAAVMALGGGDADPSTEINVWLSRGGTHIWNLGPGQTLTPWEKEIDQLMERQLVTLKYEERKKLYDRVQALVAEHLPIIPLASPNVLVGAQSRVGNFKPAILSDHVLWNAEQLFEEKRGASVR